MSAASGALERKMPPAVRAQMKANRALTALRTAVSAGGGVKANMATAARKARVTAQAAMPALASVFKGPSGPVVHIPIQIGTGPGARGSVFKLKKGQSTVAGLYVTSGGVYTREVSRKTGTGALAEGDRLEERIADARGKTVQRFSYVVTGIDASTGTMRVSNAARGTVSTGTIVNSRNGWCWICNAGSNWWCGFPCLPLPTGGGDVPRA